MNANVKPVVAKATESDAIAKQKLIDSEKARSELLKNAEKKILKSLAHVAELKQFAHKKYALNSTHIQRILEALQKEVDAVNAAFTKSGQNTSLFD